jgi:hypothetical protein
MLGTTYPSIPSIDPRTIATPMAIKKRDISLPKAFAPEAPTKGDHAMGIVHQHPGQSQVRQQGHAGEQVPGFLRTTAHHNFKTDSGWKRASQLQAGDTLMRIDDSGNSRLVRIEAITTDAPEPVFNLHTTGPHNFIAEGVLAHNFTELRWLRTWAHRLVVDPLWSAEKCFIKKGAIPLH